MFKNYLKIAFRNIWKSKGYALINITGLSVAFCVSIFLFLIAYFQLSFDDFHKDRERIFETYFVANDPDQVRKSSSMPLPLAPALKAEFPEIEYITRIVNASNVVEYKGKYFDKQVKFTDPDFLKIFTFPLVKGSVATALNDLSSIVISENMARAIFGAEDPMGKALMVGMDADKRQYIVTGVLADFPENSSIKFDAFVRTENLASYHQQKAQWDAYFHPIYLKLKPGAQQASVERRMKPFMAKYFPQNIDGLKKKGAKPDENGDLYTIRLQKMANVHFDKDISGGGGIALVYALLGIAVFILLIASINFINLNVARSFIRAREVGVRKSMGALKVQLFAQIWGEAAVICFLGFALGIVLAVLLMPDFNATFQTKLSLDYLLNPVRIAMFVGIFAVVTLLAGGYPALKMSGFNAIEVLKGKVSIKKPGVLRNSLIVTQFALSSLLICCTIIAVQQVNHLKDQPLGFQKEEVISIPVGTKINGRRAMTLLRNKLASDPQVISVSGSGVNVGVGLDRSTTRSMIGFTFNEREVTTDWLGVDYDYLKTLNIKLLDGREFDATYPGDSSDRVVITESMAKMIGEKDPVGKYFQTDTAGARIQIIGLVPDFNLYSSTAEKKPVTMHLSRDPSYLFVRVAPQGLSTSMEKLGRIWKEITPESEFRGSFLDENINNWYKEEQRLSLVFSIASGIAILLSCLGLFAVAMIVMEQRTKEIGIRKVLGASIPGLVVILSRDFVKLVLVAILISSPLAWYAMQQWLDGYSYRIDISPMVFVVVGFSAILIAILTVSFQSIKAALLNPVDSLKNE